MNTRAAVVLPAAGGGHRFGGVFKPFVDLAGQPVLRRSLRPFLEDPRIWLAVIALPAHVVAAPPAWLAAIDERVVLVEGGAERGDSVRAGLAAVTPDIDVVLIHDAARPLITSAVIDRALQKAAAGESVVVAIPATDTVQRVDGERRIVETPDRAALWLAQTPQAFPRSVIREAYARAARDDVQATDDAALVLRAGGTVRVVPGDAANIKITVPADLIVAEALLRARGEDA